MLKTSCWATTTIQDTCTSTIRSISTATVFPLSCSTATTAARGIFEDHEKGTITPGKFGDFAVLSKDPSTLEGAALFDMGVDATILGGEVVFEA